MQQKTKLIVGLGNVGQAYALTRHNIGFLAVDALADEHHASWQEKAKFFAEIAEFRDGELRCILAKPTTYMNESGRAVRALIDFYKLSLSDVAVIHDELALPFGTIRTRIGGSPAGNNGIKSVSAHIGQEYARIRIGIGNELQERMDAAQFVLGTFTKEEQDALTPILTTASRLTADFCRNNFNHETHRHEH